MNGYTRYATANGTAGSRTVTIEGVGSSDAGSSSAPGGSSDGVLRLRATGNAGPNERRVVWSDDTIDNEGMGKKKSKICCIYHKPRAFDESSSEGSSSSGSDSDSDSDASSLSAPSTASEDAGGPSMSRAMQERRQRKGKKKASSDHTHDHNCEGHQNGDSTRRPTRHRTKRSGRTVVVTQTETEDKHTGGQPDAEAGDDARPMRNAYERGVA